jgi:hypothetical protein
MIKDGNTTQIGITDEKRKAKKQRTVQNYSGKKRSCIPICKGKTKIFMNRILSPKEAG